MPAEKPEEICRLFQQYMADGNLDLALLKTELAPLAARKPHFDYDIKQVVEAEISR